MAEPAQPLSQTGDRLIPSHANKRGVRHRYYVSHRLVQPGGASDGCGWRRPARALEQAIVQVLVARFRDPVFPASIGVELCASEITAGYMRATRRRLASGRSSSGARFAAAER